MFFGLLLALARSESEEGTYSISGNYLPLLSSSEIQAKGFLTDYPENRIPIQRLFRIVSTYNVLSDNAYALQKVFGQISHIEDAFNYVYNFSSYGMITRLTNEEISTVLNLADIEQEIDPGHYNMAIWGKIMDETGANHSLLLLNTTVEFYEVIDFKYRIGSAILYLFFVGVVAFILYFIFFKKAPTIKKTQKVAKSNVRDYADIIKAGDAPSTKRNPSPKRGASPR